MLNDAQLTEIARQVADAQRVELLRAMGEVEMGLGNRASTVIVAGSGEFLARQTIERLHKPPKIVSVADRLGPEISTAACAYALATIAAQRSK
jgi:uncharacterized hydantoinase/oxoprolinase family protein